jgi:hypothetical protein
MKTTGIFKTHIYKIPVRKWGKPIRLVAFGDVHWGSPLCAENDFRRHVEAGRDDPDTYFFGMGDYQDLASATDREMLTKVLRDSSRESLETLYMDLCCKFAKEIAFMKGRVVGMVEGNHYTEFMDGRTSTMLLCERLKAAYLGCMTIVQLRFYDVRQPRRWSSIVVCAHHGKGAARLLGSSLNTVQQMAEGVEADLYLMGHDHKIGASPGSRIYVYPNGKTGELDVRERKQYFCRTGSFLRGFVNGRPSYIADKALRPVSLGGLVIEFIPKCASTISIDMRAVV